jgi:hypothetical protein
MKCLIFTVSWLLVSLRYPTDNERPAIYIPKIWPQSESRVFCFSGSNNFRGAVSMFVEEMISVITVYKTVYSGIQCSWHCLLTLFDFWRSNSRRIFHDSPPFDCAGKTFENNHSYIRWTSAKQPSSTGSGLNTLPHGPVGSSRLEVAVSSSEEVVGGVVWGYPVHLEPCPRFPGYLVLSLAMLSGVSTTARGNPNRELR